MKRRAVIVVALVACGCTLAGCDLSMTEQRKLKTYAPTTLWPDGTSARPLPDDVVAQGDVERAADRQNAAARHRSAARARPRALRHLSAHRATASPAMATASSSRTDFRRRRPITSIGCSRRRRSISTT